MRCWTPTRPDLRAGLAVGAASDAELRESFAAAFSAPLLDVYATTETCGPVAMSWPRGDSDLRCLPVPGLSVRIVDPLTGTDMGTGQEGELWVSGPNVMAGGYHNRARRDGRRAAQRLVPHR